MQTQSDHKHKKHCIRVHKNQRKPLAFAHKQAQATTLQAIAVATMIPVNLAVFRSFHENRASLQVSPLPLAHERRGRTVVLHSELHMRLIVSPPGSS